MADKRDVMEVCPICNSKMEKGYVVSKIVAWSNKKIGNWSLKGLWSGQLVISGGYPYLIQNVEAYRCTNCRLILFRYGEADDSAGKGSL